MLCSTVEDGLRAETVDKEGREHKYGSHGGFRSKNEWWGENEVDMIPITWYGYDMNMLWIQ